MARSDQHQQREATGTDSPNQSGTALSTSLIAPDGISIGAASQALGVPTRTIRSWERRYEIAAPGSTPGGHRRYREADLIRLRLMRDEIVKGRRPAQAADMVRRSLDRDSPSGRLVDRFLAAVDELDPRAMHSVLHHAHHELGIETALDDVLLPSMRLVGWWWQTGRCDVAQEHLATQAAREWLASLIVQADSPTQPRSAILACGPASQHTLGLEALAVLLTLRGLPCRTLGGRTPTRALVAAATATHAAHVVIVAHMTLNRRAAVGSIRAVAELGVSVYYAGSAFTRTADRRTLPGTYLGESLARAASTIGAARAG